MAVVDMQQQLVAGGRSDQQPPDRTDHLVAAQRTGQRLRRRRQRREQAQHVTRCVANTVQRRTVFQQQPLGDGRDDRIGAARAGGLHAQRAPATGAGLFGDLAAKRGLADAAGPAQHDGADTFGPLRAEPSQGLRDRQRAADESRAA